MNNSKEDSAVLMSIHPQYVKAIQSGDKKIEFRKRSFSKDISNILVYETAPIKAVVGYFIIKEINIDTPQKIWNKYSNVGEITKEDYFSYYNDVDIAVGICISKYISFSKPVDIKKYKLQPPQSYVYLSNDLFKKMVNVGSSK